MAEKPEQLEEGSAPKPKVETGGNKLMPIILIVNTLLMGAVLAVVLLRKPPTPEAVASTSSEHKEGDEGKKTEDGHEKSAKTEGGEKGKGDEKAVGVGAPGPILKLENFIIQLRGTDSDRYVRVAFDLELGAESDRALVQARLPHIRDSIISYFSDRSLDELRGSEGMDRIKTAVSKKLDEILSANRVRAVFITELVIQ
jgi:flagellar FliL protein